MCECVMNSVSVIISISVMLMMIMCEYGMVMVKLLFIWNLSVFEISIGIDMLCVFWLICM